MKNVITFSYSLFTCIKNKKNRLLAVLLKILSIKFQNYRKNSLNYFYKRLSCMMNNR